MDWPSTPIANPQDVRQIEIGQEEMDLLFPPGESLDLLNMDHRNGDRMQLIAMEMEPAPTARDNREPHYYENPDEDFNFELELEMDEVCTQHNTQILNLFGYPYFKDENTNGPEPLGEWEELDCMNLPSMEFRPLTQSEKVRLKVAVEKEILRIARGRLAQSAGELRRKIQLTYGADPKFQSVEASKCYLDMQDLYEQMSQQINEVPDQMVDETFFNQLNWEVIVDNVNRKSSTPRSEREVRLHYDQFLKRGITRDNWEPRDNRKLKELVTKYEKNDIDWNQVTEDFNRAMNTNRTVLDCFRRYRSRFGPERVMFWTDEDNKLLIDLVGRMEVTHREFINWRLIRPYFPGRTISQIYSHFNYQSNILCGDKFDKPELQCIALAQKAKLEEAEVMAIFGYQRTASQVRLKMKTVKRMNTAQLLKRAPRISHLIVQLMKEKKDLEAAFPRDEQAIALVNEQFFHAVETFKSRKRTGRPPKQAISEEDILRDLVRPLIIINKKRPRQSSMPGDGRIHGLVLTSLYRSLYGRFNLELVPNGEEEELNKNGIDFPYHDAFNTMMTLISQVRAVSPANLSSPESFQDRLTQFLPPTLLTLTGLRGILLYGHSLYKQTLNTYGQPDPTKEEEKGKSKVAADTDDEDSDDNDPDDEDSNEEPSEDEDVTGDPVADRLLLLRMMTLFFWPQQMRDLQIVEKKEEVLKIEEIEETPPKKMAKTTTPKKTRTPKTPKNSETPSKPRTPKKAVTVSPTENCRRGTRLRKVLHKQF